MKGVLLPTITTTSTLLVVLTQHSACAKAWLLNALCGLANFVLTIL